MKLTQPPFFRNQFIVGLLPFGTLTISKDLRYNHFGWSAPKLSIENKEFVNWIWYLNFGKVCNYVWSSLIYNSIFDYFTVLRLFCFAEKLLRLCWVITEKLLTLFRLIWRIAENLIRLYWAFAESFSDFTEILLRICWGSAITEK